MDALQTGDMTEQLIKDTRKQFAEDAMANGKDAFVSRRFLCGASIPFRGGVNSLASVLARQSMQDFWSHRSVSQRRRLNI